MNVKQNTTSEKMSIFAAIENWHKGINALLLKLESPQCVNNKVETRNTKTLLKNVMEEAITNIQKQIIMPEDSLVLQSDPTGFTKASSIYSSPEMLKKYKFSHLVDTYAKEILAKQAKSAAAEGVLISEQQLQQAKEDLNDNTKETVTVETTEQKNGEASKLVVNKETGDTELYEKDVKTGMWKKVGNTMKGWWQGIKDGFKSILNWCSKQWSRFTSWFKGIFTKPKDEDVIPAAV